MLYKSKQFKIEIEQKYHTQPKIKYIITFYGIDSNIDNFKTLNKTRKQTYIKIWKSWRNNVIYK